MSGSKHIQWLKWTTIACLLFVASACQQVPAVPNAEAAKPPANASGEQRRQQRQTETYGRPRILGTLQDAAINESSGLVASRTTPGLYWTHNDSGDGPYIYALDERGEQRGTWRVRGASARDWEDIAAGPGPQAGTSYLYIGDIGDNSGRRDAITVYRVKEPATKPTDTASNKRKPLATDDAQVINFRYPDGPHDSEALLVHPKTGDVYIVTKISFANPVIYKAAAPLNTNGPTKLERIGELNLPSLFGGLITGGDISQDGLRLALCDYLDAYELVLPGARASFDQIWKQPLQPVDLGKRRQGESIAYRLDGRALLATSEGEHSALVEVVRR
ncbi:MAG: WD40 repeat domain-containing protein [bacterium]